MNQVTVDVEHVGDRAQVVLVVKNVDSGMKMETIFPTTTNVRRLAESLIAAADEIDEPAP